MSQAVIGDLRVNLAINSAQFQAGLKGAQSSLAGLADTMRSFATTAGASLALSAIGTAALQAVRDVAAIGDLAETIGITAEQVQVFNRMALESGTTTDVMAKGLQEIAEQSTDANSKLSQLFAANGLVAQGRDVNAVIRDFMTLLRDARNPAEQLTIATGVLGTKVGRELVEALRTGAEGYDAAMKAMVKSGEYHTNAEVARLQELETKYNEIGARIAKAWQKVVVTALTPWSEMNSKIWDFPSGEAPELPRLSGFGSLGGPNEFAAIPIPVKPTILPPDKDEMNKLVSYLEGLISDSDEKGAKRLRESEDALRQLAQQLDATKAAGQQVWEATRTPLEKYQLEIRRLNDLLKAGVIDHDTYGRAVNQLQDEFASASPELASFNSQWQQLSDTLASGLSSSLTDIAFNARSAGEAFDMLRDTALGALEGITQKLLDNGINMLLDNLFRTPGGMGGGSTFGGFYANGGTLGAGKWGIAGEAGPEIIHGPARITPVDKLGARGGVSVQVINNTPAQVTTKVQENPDGSINIKALVEEQVLDTLGGGKAARVMGGRFGARITPRRT